MTLPVLTPEQWASRIRDIVKKVADKSSNLPREHAKECVQALDQHIVKIVAGS